MGLPCLATYDRFVTIVSYYLLLIAPQSINGESIRAMVLTVCIFKGQVLYGIFKTPYEFMIGLSGEEGGTMYAFAHRVNTLYIFKFFNDMDLFFVLHAVY